MPHEQNHEGSSRFLLGQLVAGQKAMDDKLDAMNTKFDAISVHALKTDDDHEERIASLEASRYRTVGAAGVISVIIGIASTWWSGK